jgi:hypothetical protein
MIGRVFCRSASQRQGGMQMGDRDDWFRAEGPGDETGAGFLVAFDDFNVGGIFTGKDRGVFANVVEQNLGPFNPAYTDHAGVLGTASNFTGVVGTSNSQPGVYGQFQDVPELPSDLRAGVLGASTAFAPGVMGWSRLDRGVEGESVGGTGVRGGSIGGTGVQGSSNEGSGVQGSSGLGGPDFQDPSQPNAKLPRPAGVFGTALDTVGVAGTSSSSRTSVLGQSGPPSAFNFRASAGVFGTSRDKHGVFGTSENALGVFGWSAKYYGVFGGGRTAGVVGEGPVGVVGISARPNDPNSYAGFFSAHSTALGEHGQISE